MECSPTYASLSLPALQQNPPHPLRCLAPLWRSASSIAHSKTQTVCSSRIDCFICLASMRLGQDRDDGEGRRGNNCHFEDFTSIDVFRLIYL